MKENQPLKCRCQPDPKIKELSSILPVFAKRHKVITNEKETRDEVIAPYIEKTSSNQLRQQHLMTFPVIWNRPQVLALFFQKNAWHVPRNPAKAVHSLVKLTTANSLSVRPSIRLSTCVLSDTSDLTCDKTMLRNNHSGITVFVTRGARTSCTESMHSLCESIAASYDIIFN